MHKATGAKNREKERTRGSDRCWHRDQNRMLWAFILMLKEDSFRTSGCREEQAGTETKTSQVAKVENGQRSLAASASVTVAWRMNGGWTKRQDGTRLPDTSHLNTQASRGFFCQQSICSTAKWP